MTRFPSIRVGGAVTATAVFTVLASGCGEYSNPNYAGPRPFDAEQWRSGETLGFSDKDAPRLRMADGLVEDGTLLGKSRAEIAAMLGPPTTTAKFSNYDLVYWLGPERGFMSIDSEWLAIDFDPLGICSEVTIVRD